MSTTVSGAALLAACCCSCVTEDTITVVISLPTLCTDCLAYPFLGPPPFYKMTDLVLDSSYTVPVTSGNGTLLIETGAKVTYHPNFTDACDGSGALDFPIVIQINCINGKFTIQIYASSGDEGAFMLFYATGGIADTFENENMACGGGVYGVSNPVIGLGGTVTLSMP